MGGHVLWGAMLSHEPMFCNWILKWIFANFELIHLGLEGVTWNAWWLQKRIMSCNSICQGTLQRKHHSPLASSQHIPYCHNECSLFPQEVPQKGEGAILAGKNGGKWAKLGMSCGDGWLSGLVQWAELVKRRRPKGRLPGIVGCSALPALCCSLSASSFQSWVHFFAEWPCIQAERNPAILGKYLPVNFMLTDSAESSYQFSCGSFDVRVFLARFPQSLSSRASILCFMLITANDSVSISLLKIKISQGFCSFRQDFTLRHYAISIVAHTWAINPIMAIREVNAWFSDATCRERILTWIVSVMQCTMIGLSCNYIEYSLLRIYQPLSRDDASEAFWQVVCWIILASDASVLR